MRRGKKFILIALMTIVVLAGTIGGVVFANTDDEDGSRAASHQEAMLNKVCEIYENNTGTAIDSQELQKAFAEARNEVMVNARENFRQKLIDEGKITQEQLDEHEAWLEARPETPFPFGHGNPDDIKPFGGRHRSFGMFGGDSPGFGGPCAPAQ